MNPILTSLHQISPFNAVVLLALAGLGAYQAGRLTRGLIRWLAENGFTP